MMKTTFIRRVQCIQCRIKASSPRFKKGLQIAASVNINFENFVHIHKKMPKIMAIAIMIKLNILEALSGTPYIN